MDGFLGEIRMFAGPYAPEDWALCGGQVLTVAGNEALFSLLGTTYGGDGVTNFALPDLRGRLAVHAGQQPGMPINHPRGQKFGTETVTLTEATMPAHSHAMRAVSQSSTSEAPEGLMLGINVPTPSYPTFSGIFNTTAPVSTPTSNTGPMAEEMIGSEGANQQHYNVMPSLVINFIIALKGSYPTRP
ncbi:tail fiber protein [Tistrella bauzanensis]|jgi:microcystin-dependent protein|uniref:Tail fiber protein n=1 Tax=Tistrella arctica TaxID=3133430 RepID=A0ABU9YK70_9PROT